jgi:hypothetical protein
MQRLAQLQANDAAIIATAWADRASQDIVAGDQAVAQSLERIEVGGASRSR